MDHTKAVLDKLVGPPLKDTDVLSIDSLKARLKERFESVVPVAPSLHRDVVQALGQDCAPLTRPSTTETCNFVGSFYQGVTTSPPAHFASEADMHYFVDSVLRMPLENASDALKGTPEPVSLKFERDTAEANTSALTTAVRTRRDFRVMVGARNLAALHGEEKAQFADFGLAQAEMLSKLGGWSATYLGSAPYLIGCAVGGSAMQFFAIVAPAQPGAQPLLVPITNRFDLEVAHHRQAVYVVSLRLLRVLEWLSWFPPQGAPALGTKEQRESSGKVIEFNMSCVRLSVAVTQERYDNGLWNLYRKLSKAAPKPAHLALPRGCGAHRQHALEVEQVEDNNRKRKRSASVEEVMEGDRIKVCITPVCLKARPRDLNETVNMALDVLEALEGLHKLNFVHRDVRMDNIMLGPGLGWFLVDLDEAAEMESDKAPWPHWALNHEAKHALRWSKLDGDKEAWTPKHDVAMLAHVVASFAQGSEWDPFKGVCEAAKVILDAGDANEARVELLAWKTSNLVVG